MVIGDFIGAPAADSKSQIESYWSSGPVGETVRELYREMSFNKSDFNVTVVRVDIDDPPEAATAGPFFSNGQQFDETNYYAVAYEGSYVQVIDDVVAAQHGLLVTDYDYIQYVLPAPSGNFGNTPARRSVVLSPTNAATLAHEFGHSFRWGHSYNQTITGWTLPGNDPNAGERISLMYGNGVLVGDNVVRKDEAGWLVPDTQILTITEADSGRYTLHRVEDQSRRDADPLGIKVLFPHSTDKHYYVSYRQWDGVNGFDSNNNDTAKGDYSAWNERVFLHDDTRWWGLYGVGLEVDETYTAAGIHIDHVGSPKAEETKVIITFLQGPLAPVGELAPLSPSYSEYIQLGEEQRFDLFLRNMDGYGTSAPTSTFNVSATHPPEFSVTGLAPTATLAPGEFYKDANVRVKLNDPIADGIYEVDIEMSDPAEPLAHAFTETLVYRVDTTPPSTPIVTSAALEKGKNAIYWTESTDSSPVEYFVYRDGTEIGTTTVGYFRDSGSRQDHIYGLFALDGRLQRSPWAHAHVSGGSLLATNQGPDLTLSPAAPYEVVASTEIGIAALVSDVDGDTVTLSAPQLPAGSTFAPATGLFSWIPDSGQAGSHDVIFSAVDDNPIGGDATEKTITIAVLEFVDTDGDGVPDQHDNCVLVANGPLASAPGTVCNSQEDGDLDGYGSPCDFDVDNDGGTSINDALEFLAHADVVSTDPVYDPDCDGATSFNDYLAALDASATLETPGPSGLACASLCETPAFGCLATGYPCPSPWLASE